MNNEPTRHFLPDEDAELLDAACDREIRAADGSERVEQLASVIDAIRSSESTPPLSADFNERLRERWNQQIAPAPRRTARRPFVIGVPLAAAAVLALLLAWPGMFPTRRNDPTSTVAWGDVVRAINQVSNLHITFFGDDPRAADVSRKLYRLDVFYQQPDRFRAHGFNLVQIMTGGTKRTWNISKRAWAEAGERNPDILQDRLTRQLNSQGLMPIVLGWFFKDNPPPGEPVKSDEVASAAGIDVFDYARSATQPWIRIWVLRESKLPLRIHVYEPDSDAFSLVTFDYSDPQPESFFDAEKFATEAAKFNDREAAKVFNIGSRPISGKPRGSTQIHDVTGGYKAPAVKRVVKNSDGDVCLITGDTSNLSPQGRAPLDQKYENVTDNWGNTYIATRVSGSSGQDQSFYFIPLPPFQQGTGQHTLTATFVLRVSGNNGIESKALETIEVDVPAAGVGVLPKDFDREWPARRERFYRDYLVRNGTLAEQMAQIDKALTRDPKDLNALVWKFNLLREHDREDAAWTLFEQSIRDRVFADAKSIDEWDTPASKYLLYLAANDRRSDFEQWAGKVLAARQAADAAAKRNSAYRGVYNNLTRENTNWLMNATNAYAWREQFKDAPRVVRTAASRDGMVFVELQIPKPPAGWESTGWMGNHPMGWFWEAQPKDFAKQAQAISLDDGRQLMVLRGAGKTLTLNGDVQLLADNMGSAAHRNNVTLHWEKNIAIPEPTVDQMQPWWQEQTKAINGSSWYPFVASTTAPAPMPGEQFLVDAQSKLAAKAWDEALALLDKAMAAPAEQWPAYYNDAENNPDLMPRTRRLMQILRATALAELGRFDDARAAAESLWSQLPAEPNLNDYDQGHIAIDAVKASIQVPRVLLAQGNAAAAQIELDRIAQRRPGAATLSEDQVMVPRGKSMRVGWSPRFHHGQAWRDFDTIWWKVRDALTAE